MHEKQSNSLGIILILLGIILVCKMLFDWDFSIFFDGWWTLFIIIPNILSIKKEGTTTKNLVGLGIGIALLLSARDIISFGTLIKLAIPVSLIIWGCRIVFDSHSSRKRIACGNTISREGCPEFSSIFGHQKITCNNEVFAGATCNAIFGGIDVDLRTSYISENVTMTCSSIFGGITVYMPPNVNVHISCIPIFGGVDNRLTKRNIPGAPTLYITATCMFGGLDIK